MLSTRNKIIVIADQLIRQNGYNAFSYADIAKKLKLKNAAIHYHFPSKAALGMAVIEETREKFLKSTVLWASLSVTEQLTAFMEMYSKNGKHNCICFMGALGADFNTLPAEMAAELQAAHTDIKQWLIKILSTGQQNNTLNFNGSPAEFSDLITSSLLASLVLARVSDQSQLTNVRQLLMTQLVNNTPI